MVESAPHEADVPALATRRGGFWIVGDRIDVRGNHAQRGPMWVEWEAPETVSGRYPLILVHGGGGQGTDWLTTPDGRQGWAREFVAAGYAVYVVDRPGHGRSPDHPAVLGAAGAPGTVEMTVGVFAPPPLADVQTQWVWGRDESDPVVAQLTASADFLLDDLAEANALDGARLAELLDVVGPAVLVTHSLGSLGGWLATALRPGKVAAVVAVEPTGPPYVEIPGLGALAYGLTATPLPNADTALETRSIDGFAGLPIAIVTGSASLFAGSAPAVADHLRIQGADVELLPLGESDIVGNGHGLIFEKNSAATAGRVLAWIDTLE